LLFLIDHPLISSNLVDGLIDDFYSSHAAVVLPTYQGRRGHPVLFSAKVYRELESAPLETGARAVVWAHASDVREFQTIEEGCVLNLNDPETFARFTNRV
jgi:molybdenum cofactor cytidylyltransferase